MLLIAEISTAAGVGQPKIHETSQRETPHPITILSATYFSLSGQTSTDSSREKRPQRRPADGFPKGLPFWLLSLRIKLS